jgi:small conductance mechanosensitive channel
MNYSLNTLLDPILRHTATLVDRLPGAVLVALLLYVAIRILQGILGISLRAARMNRAMQDIVLSVASIVLWIGSVALVFQSLGLNQIAIALSGSVAVIGLGIATGANKLVADIVAGLFLSKTRDFKVGTRIKTADVEGRVHSLDSRKTRIVTKDGTLFVVPNSKFDDQTWQIFPDDEDQKEKD